MMYRMQYMYVSHLSIFNSDRLKCLSNIRTLHLALLPSCMGNARKAVNTHLKALLNRYVKDFEAIIIGKKNNVNVYLEKPSFNIFKITWFIQYYIWFGFCANIFAVDCQALKSQSFLSACSLCIISVRVFNLFWTSFPFF